MSYKKLCENFAQLSLSDISGIASWDSEMTNLFRCRMPVHVPLEIARMICTYVDTQWEDADDSVDNYQVPYAIRDLQSLRLVNRMFAQAGGELLFRKFDTTLTRSQTCPGALVWGSFEGQRDHHDHCKYCNLHRGRFSGLHKSRFVTSVQELGFQFCIDEARGPAYYKDVPSNFSPFSRYTNVKLIRFSLVDTGKATGVEWSHDPRADLTLWINIITKIVSKLPNLAQFAVDCPPEYGCDILPLILASKTAHAMRYYTTATPRREKLILPRRAANNASPVMSLGPTTPWANSWTSFDLSTAQLEDLAFHISKYSCPELQFLRLDSVVVYGLPAFLVRSHKTLQDVTLIALEHDTALLDDDSLAEWAKVFESLGMCHNLTHLTIKRAHIRTANSQVGLSGSLHMPALKSLELEDVEIRADDLTRMITANCKSLQDVELNGVTLDCSYLPKSPGIDGRQRWLPVIQSLFLCKQLRTFTPIQLVLSRESYSQSPTFVRGVDIDGFSCLRTSPRSLQYIIGSESPDHEERLEVFHLLGEILRSAMIRLCTSKDCGKNGSSEEGLSSVSTPVADDEITNYLLSLYPLADIKTGKVTHKDIYPWDPINGLRVKTLPWTLRLKAGAWKRELMEGDNAT